MMRMHVLLMSLPADLRNSQNKGEAMLVGKNAEQKCSCGGKKQQAKNPTSGFSTFCPGMEKMQFPRA